MDWDQIQASSYGQWLLAHQGWLAPMILLIAFAESFAIVGIVVPGIVLLAIAAFLAGTGVLDLYTALACACAGAIIGDGSSFFIGRHFHRHLAHIWPFRQHRTWLEKGERFFHRHGVISILAGRFIGPIRPVMPLVAGSLLMPTPLFLTINIASALAWAPVYILPGYLAGSALDYPLPAENMVVGAVAILLLTGIAAFWLRRRFYVEAE